MNRIVQTVLWVAIAAGGAACAASPPSGSEGQGGSAGGGGGGGAGGGASCQGPADCPPTGDTCVVAICDAGQCSTANAAAGKPAPEQIPGDCLIQQCDGSGNMIGVADDEDLPVDGDACTSDVCKGGVPSNPALSAGAACSEGGGAMCDGKGACVECLTAADCPGQDSACQKRTCTAGACGVENAPAGTPIASQLAGDCKQTTCDGSGGTTSTNADADVPVDGTACTGDVCTAGVPSNPPLAAGTACNQSGGKVCNGSGLCVQCNTGAQCASGVCASGVCQAASCADGIKNGSETDIDCGGSKCAPCAAGKTCLAAADCQTGVCTAGVCQAPSVLGTTPSDGATGVSVDAAVAVAFSGAMDPTTLAAQTTIGPCAGTIQLSTDGFSTCLGFASATPTMLANNTIASLTPSPALSHGTTYAIRVTAAAKGAGGTPIAATYTTSTGFSTAPPPASPACASTVVVSQVYGGGGNSGATYKNDFVELHNRGNTTVSLAGWSVQYASAAGTTWLVTNLSDTIAPGGYFLVQLAGGASGVALPAPDATGGTNMSATAGKVALVNTTTALSGACPSGAQIMDLVGYGGTASCFEGAAAAPGASGAAQSIQRTGGACTDTGNNSADFAAGPVAPRNSASMASVCACPGEVTANESGQPYEIDYCNVQFPSSLTVSASTTTPVIYGRVFEAGVTEAFGANPTLQVQVGFGPASINPTTQSGWQFFPATFHIQAGNDDEYQGSFTAPTTPGSYRYAYRMSLDGTRWTYCDLNGTGSDPGFVFEVTQLPSLTVN